MNQAKQPLVSIGLPVYNGNDYLESSLNSILGQSYRNIELIICDNASTDGTRSIIEHYLKKDERIQYHRHAENMGAGFNYNSTFKLSSGKYFKWAAHDDIMHKNYIEECIHAMESDDSISLVQPLTGQIDENGSVTTHAYTGVKDIIPNDASDREQYRILMQDRGAWVRIFGLIRSSILKNTPLIDSYVGSDLTLLGELGLNGKVVDLGTVMFWRREHENTSTQGEFKPRRKRLAWFDTTKKNKTLSLPEWKLTTECFRSISRQSIPFSSKLYCYNVILVRMWRRKRILAKDIFYSITDLINIFRLNKQPKSTLG